MIYNCKRNCFLFITSKYWSSLTIQRLDWYAKLFRISSWDMYTCDYFAFL